MLKHTTYSCCHLFYLATDITLLKHEVLTHATGHPQPSLFGRDLFSLSTSVKPSNLDRDRNAAINIRNLAIGHFVNKAQVTPDGIPGVTEKPALYA